ncbi:RhoGAP and Fes/CIP4 domain-containing protein [Histoplasma capsulatum G186AR]|uniref:RhoGAP and Fes/CIP4 domain-containing protein n=1 Tax=Ajellomyces capsulatus TaxID=5037 RepID=A0A8H8CVI1_AJECA|nr:RhoGAP and Fes/CIP4 domain-containing protein [Histoplasma capsulatum]QSS68635.1 RhoGAP and Fes/CIP4 domain-containing protein [Histoplasma capsulatum G186AR]
MRGFADSFWTPDYASGLGVLISKLQQGIVENQQILTIANMRAAAEEQYSSKLGEIAPAIDRMTNGFARDDGASVRKAYEGIRSEMIEATKNHQKIANSIRELVVNPFGRWADQHELRILNSQEELQTRIKEHYKQSETVKKLRTQYFNKCRLVEDLEEENKLAFQSPEKESADSPKAAPPHPPTIVLPDASEDFEPVELGDKIFPPEELKKLLTHMLESIKLGEVKFPILGTYQNTSTGADIVDFIQKSMGASTISYAERIGQDLVDNGFLRLVGNVGSTFANSSRMNYQWRSKSFQISGIPEKKKPLMRVTSMGSGGDEVADSPTAVAVADLFSQWNPLNNSNPNETPAQRLRREAREADERYKAAVKKLDRLRCHLEEEMIDYLKFMERCELDRLKAIKAVVLDFSGAISNVVPSLRSTVDKMMLYQETIQPLGDLRYLLENYRTGAFVPRVQPYENYYGNVDEQTFGVDLEARARADRKRVPILITTILTYLDNHYPDLEGDEARRAIWLHEVPLVVSHHLRNALNNGKPFSHEVLEKYDIPVVANVLKLYLLELPDSLVSSQVYEIVKTVYTTTNEAPAESRVKVLQSTLGQLRLNNIATLDAIITHFTRLIDLTSADEAYVTALAQNMAPCILRPRLENNLTMDERHSYRLLRDLFDHKDEIFGELKRQSSTLGSLGPGSRPRAISTDESNRRANMEARQRAIVDRSRANSPAPANRHRRDKSIGGESTRFPVNVSSPPASATGRGPRHSLEVPDSAGSSPAADRTGKPTIPSATVRDSITTNGSAGASTVGGDHTATDSISSTTTLSDPHAPASTTNNVMEKSNSLSRSSGRYSRITGLKRDSVVENDKVASEAPKPAGVTLQDAPMDD